MTNNNSFVSVRKEQDEPQVPPERVPDRTPTRDRDFDESRNRPNIIEPTKPWPGLDDDDS
jgi:hypothetical protein